MQSQMERWRRDICETRAQRTARLVGREGIRNIENVNRCLGRATPWFSAGSAVASRKGW